tara:strand:- start:2074 stop:3555 length:1482 start_codon:yes stop_codon:yes gene_type:complete
MKPKVVKSITFFLLQVILIFHYSCQKDYYLEELNQAEMTFNSLSSKLNQINSENQQLVSQNQQLAFEISTLLNQLESSSISLTSALELIEDIEEELNLLEQEKTKELNAIQSDVEKLLTQLKTDFPKETELKFEMESLIEKLSQETITVLEAKELYQKAADAFAIVKGVQDGLYKTFRVASRLDETSYKNNDFILHFISSQHYYFEIEKVKIQTVSIVRKDNDFKYFENPYSSEPFVDKNITFSGNHNIEVLGVDRIKIVVEYQINESKLYDIFYLAKTETIPYNKTNEELQTLFREKKTGFFSDPIYSQVDVTDLSSFLSAFIEDGKRYGRDMSWINPNNYTLRFDSFSSFIAQNDYDPLYQIDYESVSCEGGGRTTKATFRISRNWWDKLYFVDLQNLHIQILWRIFASVLFTYNYFEGEGHLLSYGGTYYPYDFTFNDPEEKYNFQEAARKMFQGVDQNSWSGCSSKQGTPFKTHPKKTFLKHKEVTPKK